MPLFRMLTIVSLIFFYPSVVRAGFIVFEGSGTNSGKNLKARATFVNDATGKLTITLENILGLDFIVQNDVLTAVFFDLANNPVLTRDSAVLGTGSHVFKKEYSNFPLTGFHPDYGVGGEYAYKHTGSGFGSGISQKQGISSTGLGDIFGTGDRFSNINEANLHGNKSPNGIAYGIIGQDPTSVNGGLINIPLINNSVVLTLSGLPGSFNAATDVSNVQFQYGTDLSGPSYKGYIVPAPSSIILMLIGLGVVLAVRRYRRIGFDRLVNAVD